jgi:hypothetical protein
MARSKRAKENLKEIKDNAKLHDTRRDSSFQKYSRGSYDHNHRRDKPECAEAGRAGGHVLSLVS